MCLHQTTPGHSAAQFSAPALAPATMRIQGVAGGLPLAEMCHFIDVPSCTASVPLFGRQAAVWQGSCIWLKTRPTSQESERPLFADGRRIGKGLRRMGKAADSLGHPRAP